MIVVMSTTPSFMSIRSEILIMGLVLPLRAASANLKGAGEGYIINRFAVYSGAGVVLQERASPLARPGPYGA